jgi:acyl dehydratase
LSHFLGELLIVDDAAMAVNYGLDRVRFPAAVRSGSRLSATAEVREVRPEASFTTMGAHLEMRTDSSARPCCVVDSVTRYVHAAQVAV